MNDKYLTPRQLAAELGISLRTLCRWNLLRKAPTCSRVGNLVLYRREAVDQWLRANESMTPGTSS
jgi:excisionase family DNA binding protein